jgi:hypothetical protein
MTLLVTALLGCTDPDPIQQYTVARQKPDDTTPKSNPLSQTTPPPSPDSLPFTYTKPEGWRDAPVVPGIQLIAFKVGEEMSPLTISVSLSGGGLALNVNRWRGQAGLPELSESEIDAGAQSIPVDGEDAKYFVVEGQERSILGVIAQRDGRQWFLKSDGPPSLVDQERANFETFVKSIRFK